jgi:O-antigen ligase
MTPSSRARFDATKLLEAALVIILLAMFSEGVLPRLVTADQNVDGSPLLRQLWLPVYAIVFMCALTQIKQFYRLVWRLPFLFALLALVGISTLWSIDSAVTARRAVAVLMTTMFGLYLASRYNWRDMLRVFGFAWIFIAVANFIASAGFPGFGTMTEVHVGAWRGLFWEKNAMGGHMARASFLFGFLLLLDERSRKIWAFGLALTIGLVLLSTSKTSLLGMLMGFGILGIGGWMRRSAVSAISFAWFGVTSAGAFVLMLALAPDAVFGLIGRDASLTGRTEIWGALMGAIQDRPWLGFGYGVFWGPDSEPAYWIREQVEWDAPTAHNGWLDIWISVGAIGLALFVANFILIIVRSCAAALSGWTGIFAFGFVAQFVLFSLSESIILQQNAIVWVTYAAICGRLALDAANTADSRRKRRKATLIKPRTSVKI